MACTPSDVQLETAIRRLLPTVDLTVVTPKTLRKKLEVEFDVDLTSRKQFIRSHIEAFLSSLQAEEQEEEEGDDDDDDDDDANQLGDRLVYD